MANQIQTLNSLYEGYYFITDINGTPQGIDQASGGYPYCATHPNNINYWRKDHKKDVDSYLDVLNWKHKRGEGPKEYFLCQITGITGMKI